MSEILCTCHIIEKSIKVAIKEKKGIDSALQKQTDIDTAKWKQLLRCILDVILFLAERNLPFCGSSSAFGDSNIGQFLGMLELLSKHNKVLEMHLRNMKQHQHAKSRMEAHYLSWTSQNEILNACGKQIQDAIVKEYKNALYYSVIVDGIPDVSHTEQITFVLRYVHKAEDSVWAIKECFLL